MVYQTTPLMPTPNNPSQRMIQEQRAPYSPSSLRRWVQQQDPNPDAASIAAEGHRRRHGVHSDMQEYPANNQPNWLHPHFCLQKDDRELVRSEGMMELKDTVTAMGRAADVLHVSFTVSPEWTPSQLLDPFYIHVETITSRQVEQTVEWAGIVSRMKDIVQYELAPAHIMRYHQKLNEILPSTGYAVDRSTDASMSKTVVLDMSSNAKFGTACARSALACFGPRQQPVQSPARSPVVPPTPSKKTQCPPPPSHIAALPTISKVDGNKPSLLAQHGRPNPPAHREAVTSQRHKNRDTHQVVHVISDDEEWTDVQGNIPITPAKPPVVAAAGAATSTIDVSDDETFESSARQGPRESDWIVPPAGSPPASSSPRRLTSSLPPDYYIHPRIVAFGFPPLVAHLLQIMAVAPAMLCAIDATRDYELSSWRGRFIAAGLSEEDAERVEQVFLASMSREQRDLLRIASGSQTARVSIDSISTVSSLSIRE